jgi:hypothetical protein
MLRIRSPRISLFLSTLLAGSGVFADDQVCETVPVIESPELDNQIDGATEPEKIPDWLKYHLFVSMYSAYERELVQELSQTDHAILNDLVVNNDQRIFAENGRYSSEMLNLCTKGETLDAVVFATEYERIVAESHERMEDQVRYTLDILSNSGRQTIERFIGERVTPKLSFPRTSTVDLAEMDPEDVRFEIDVTCHEYLYGQPSPETQRRMECLQQQLELHENPIAIKSESND